MLFKEIIGHHDLKARLIQSVKDNRVSHAQLFFGDEGRGKLALALAYAQYISCNNKQADDSCGQCPSCVKYQNLAHPDLHFIYPTTTLKGKKAVSTNFITQWREFVFENQAYVNLSKWYQKIEIENKQGIISADDCNDIVQKLSLKSYESEFKVLIIWMADKLYPTAAPKILKALEEPPEKTLFLLLTESPDKLLKTILSRTQRIYIPPIDDMALGQYLAEENQLNDLQIERILKQAKGNLIKTRELINNDDDKNDFFEQYRQMMRMSYAYKVPEIIQISRDLASKGREWQKQYLEYCTNCTQHSFYISEQQSHLVQNTDDEMEFFTKIAPFINANKISGFRDIFETALYHISRNGNAKLVMTDMLLELSRWFKK